MHRINSALCYATKMKKIAALFLFLAVTTPFLAPRNADAKLFRKVAAIDVNCGEVTDELGGIFDAAEKLEKADKDLTVPWETLCLGNPAAAKLFDDFKGKSDPRLISYCKYKPVFRLCFVCNMIASKGKDASFSDCQDRLASDDLRKSFKDLMGIK